MNKVYVVTNPELGWDCVIGVYEVREDAEKYCAQYEGVVPYDKWREDESVLVIHDEWFHRNKQVIRDNKIDEVLKP